VIAAIRHEVGNDFHLQVKLSSADYNNALSVFDPPGNTLDDTLEVVRWAEEAGADAIHVSTGSSFPHPKNPPGDFPVKEALKTYDSMISSGRDTFRNYLLLRNPITAALYQQQWVKARGPKIEGINLDHSAAIKAAVGIPVICTGGFQNAPVIRDAISSGMCDAVSIARSLVANNNLVQMFAAGMDAPPKPCTYCNKCLVNVIENPLGCYEESRFDSREQMIREILSVFEPAPFSEVREAHA
jgi:2,4-dienoyl-CoA reductase (NADPH2)